MATRKEISQANVEDQDNVEMDDENSAIDLQDLVNAEHVEIIIGCLEEVHKVLINAYELLVSVRFKWMPPYNCEETAAKNKVFTMTQNICYLCEMGIFWKLKNFLGNSFLFKILHKFEHAEKNFAL
jgi:hypothetical protein